MKNLLHKKIKTGLEEELEQCKKYALGLGLHLEMKAHADYWLERTKYFERLLMHFNTRTLFIFPNLDTTPSWSPAIQILSSYLKEKGYYCEAIHLNQSNRKGLVSLIEDIEAFQPKVIGFTCTSFEYNQANLLAGMIKKIYSDRLLILGGIHATLHTNQLIESNFDGFCIGEGEIPLLNLLKHIEKKEGFHQTNGFVFKKDNKIVYNGVGKKLKELDEIEMMDWEILDTPKILEARNGWLSIGFSRGCPYNCHFCVNSALRKIKGAEGYVRKKSVDKVIKELNFLARKYYHQLKVFNLDDDLLMSDHEWMKEFLQKYYEDIYLRNIGFKIEARIDNMNPEMIGSLKKSGCIEVQFGVECGNEEYRSQALNKRISNQQIIQVFKKCDDVGLRTMAFMMFGLPEETESQVQESFELLSRVQPDLVRPSFFYPIYGTQLHNVCVKKGLMRDNARLVTPFDDTPLKTKMGLKNLRRMVKLSPWYINVLLGHKNYERVIKTFDRFDNKKDLLAKDLNLSKRTKGLHYRYFKNNDTYLEKVMKW